MVVGYMGFLNHLHVYLSKNSTIAAQSITRHPRKAKQTGGPNQPFVRVHLHPNTAGTEKRPPEQFVAAFGPSLPTLDNLRNFFLTPTTEVLSFLQHLREAP